MADRKGSTCRCCFENGRFLGDGITRGYHSPRACQAYSAQMAFGRKMRRLTEDEGRSVRTVPASPDYSTRAAVDARIREAGTGQQITATDPTFKRLYREFCKVAAPVTVADLHVSKWRVVRVADTFDGAGRLVTPAHWDLTDTPAPTATIAQPRRARRVRVA